ncbi:MAG: hypothetical protein HY303_18165 [Candidatus Wallbacteria bacterium]|nr:hypothetical protein [Candidatus Wallbacteria bacterium]
MIRCSHCRRPLGIPSSGNTVSCPSCWRTNFFNREARPAGQGPSEAVDPQAARPTDVAIADDALQEFWTAARSSAGWIAWAAWQAWLVAAAVWTADHLGNAISAFIAGRVPDPKPLAPYLRWVPHVTGLAAYLALLELCLLLHGWHQRVRRSGQSAPTVALMLWHRLVLGVWRGVTVTIAGLAAGGVVYAMMQAQPRNGGPAAAFLGLLVFLILGFTRMSLVLYACLFVGALAGAADCLMNAPSAAPIVVELGVRTFRIAPSEGLMPTLALLVASALLLYAETLSSRAYGFCRRCAGYVRKDEASCPLCALSWDGSTVSPPVRHRARSVTGEA